jgi:restriction system protein
MAIPDYQTLMLPVLRALQDGKERHIRDVINRLGDEFSLTSEERNVLLPSGKQKMFDNRIGWAKTYLKKAGLIESVKRGYVRISERGSEELKRNPGKIDVTYLNKFQAFQEFRELGKNKVDQKGEEDNYTENTPEEQLEIGFQKITKSLSSELLDLIKSCTPEFFERLVIQLLLKMGYGGSREDAGKRIGGSGDGGIDGVINEDKLGLDVIYIQAKKWEGSVGRPEIQKFVGALQGQRAKKGIFITTSSFTSDAKNYPSQIENRVVLIDGEQLAQFMIDHNVGVSTVDTYEIKKIDSDFFSEEQY